MRHTASTTNGKSETVLLSGGDPILRRSWCVPLLIRFTRSLDCSPPVPFHSRAYNQAQGVQEALLGPDARAEYVFTLCPATLSDCFAEVLAVPKNMKLLAIPLFELYDNAARYVSLN